MTTHPTTFTLPGPPSPVRGARARRTGAIPGLLYRPAVPADPEKVRQVDLRVETWARANDLFPSAWQGDFAGFQFGRAVVLQHPGAADLDRLTAAGKLLLAENIVDSCYCEEDEGRGERARAWADDWSSPSRHSTRTTARPNLRRSGGRASGRTARCAPTTSRCGTSPRWRHPARPTGSSTTSPGCTWATWPRPPGRRPGTCPRSGSTW